MLCLYHFVFVGQNIQSLKIDEALNNDIGIASSFNNIGLIYKEQQDYDLALNYYEKSLKIQSLKSL